jgi:hypothetical protein
VLGPVDHAGYLFRDLSAGVALMQATFGLPVVRNFELPQFALEGTFLGEGTGSVEVFAFTDPALADSRLGDAQSVLDHVAYLVPDISSAAATLSSSGVSFSGPDLRREVTQPIDLGGVHHLWTMPSTTGGLCLQLIQRG